MKKTDVVKELSVRSGLSREEARRALNNLLDIIRDGMKTDGVVVLDGFGKFYVTEYGARTITIPKDKQAIEIESRRSPRFKASKILKDDVRQGD